jgi:protein-tyrosine phosphatase
MDFVTNRIAVGSKNDLCQKQRLNKNGITGILNVAKNLDVNHFNPRREDKVEGAFSYDYAKVGMNDSANNRPETLVAAVLMLEQLLERNEKVLVNCRAGASRSATVVALYLVKHKGMTYDEALAMMKTKRNRIGPGRGMRQLAAEVVNKKMLEGKIYL